LHIVNLLARVISFVDDIPYVLGYLLSKRIVNGLAIPMIADYLHFLTIILLALEVDSSAQKWLRDVHGLTMYHRAAGHKAMLLSSGTNVVAHSLRAAVVHLDQKPVVSLVVSKISSQNHRLDEKLARIPVPPDGKSKNVIYEKFRRLAKQQTQPGPSSSMPNCTLRIGD
jgi:hypothetical protein